MTLSRTKTRLARRHAVSPEWTAWHLLFERLVVQRSPKSFEVRPEVPLGNTQPRLDLLLLRRKQGPGADRGARVLRGLWPTIDEVMVLEFKSSARAVRRGELFRLLAYACLYVDESRKGRATGVRLGLVVANVTPSLSEELRAMGARLPARQGGYAVVKLKPFEMVLAVVDEVAQSEKDQLLGAFAQGALSTVGDKLWWNRELGRNMATLKSLPDYAKVVKKEIAALPVEARLEGLSKAQLKKLGELAFRRAEALKQPRKARTPSKH